MADSPEHQFIAEQLDNTLSRVSHTRLFGITEAQRRVFDYACILFRDFSRPLVSQVLWRHEEGIDKDLRTLLHDEESVLKVYLIEDTVRARARLDEVLSSYRSHAATRKLLRGLRLIFLPAEFDADRPADRQWMATYLEQCVMQDLLFGVLFGRLNSFEFRIFLDHDGPVGLKYAMLHEITENGLYRMRTFKDRIGYKTNGPIREVLTMLVATGLVRRIEQSNCCVPTIKGRLLLDLTRLLMFEVNTFPQWSDETLVLLKHLGIHDMPRCQMPQSKDHNTIKNPVARNLLYAFACASHFGKDLLQLDGHSDSLRFYSSYNWKKFSEPVDIGPVNYARWLADEESLFFPEGEFGRAT